MKRALIIYNPSAGIRSASDISAEVQKKLQKMEYSANVFFLDADFEKNISGFDFDNLSLIVAIGGDGTVRVATRTILENKLNAKLAIVPFGSANIIAKSLGLPISVRKAIKGLDDDNLLPMDVGIINDKYYFLVGFAAGYISEVVATTATKLKNYFGFLSYIINLLINNIEIRRKNF